MRRIQAYIHIIISLLLIVFTSCSMQDGQDGQDGVYTTESDLYGKKVAVTSGSVTDIQLREQYPEIERYYAADLTGIFLSVINRQAYATLTEKSAAKHLVKMHPNLMIADKPFKTHNLGVGMGFHDSALRDKFNGYIAELKESGELARITDKWENDFEEGEMPEFNFSTKNGILKVGITIVLPHNFIRDNRYCGLEIELISGFCEKMEMTPVFEVYAFAGLLAAASTGKIDVISSRMGITEERAKAVAFSDPYFFPTTVVLMRNPDYRNTTPLLKRIKLQFYNNIVAEDRYLLLLEGLEGTVKISFLSIIFGTLLGGIICSLRMSRKKVLSEIARIYIELWRCIPPLVVLMLLFYVVFGKSGLNGVAVSTITFSLFFAASVSEISRSSIESIDKGQMRAGTAMGFSKYRAFIYIVAPQALKIAFPLYKGQTMSLIKMTSIVGYIATADLTHSGDIIRTHSLDAFFPLMMVALIYLMIMGVAAGILSLCARMLGTR